MIFNFPQSTRLRAWANSIDRRNAFEFSLVLTPQHKNISKPPIHALFSGELQNLNVVGKRRLYREFETPKIEFFQVS